MPLKAYGPWADVIVIVLIFRQRCHATFSFCNIKFVMLQECPQTINFLAEDEEHNADFSPLIATP